MLSTGDHKHYINTILPTQTPMNEFFIGDEEDLFAAIYKTGIRLGNIQLPDELFEIKRSPQFPIEEMASNPMVLKLLQFLISLTKSKRILEIGTFVGVSSMYMANVLPKDGILTTVEKYDHFADIAKENFILNNLDKKIELVNTDALLYLKELDVEDKFDLIFLDGNKEQYSDYFELIDPVLTKNGLLIVDDIFFCGDSLNGSPNTEKGLGVKKFLDKIEKSNKYNKVVLPISDGILLMLKTE